MTSLAPGFDIFEYWLIALPLSPDTCPATADDWPLPSDLQCV